MSKNKEEVELRTVDEEAEAKSSRLVRLNEDSVEEVVDEDPVKIGGRDGGGDGLEDFSREEMKIRSSEPDVRSLIEGSDEVLDRNLEENWEAAKANERKFSKGWLWLVVVLFLTALIWSLVKVVTSEKKQVGIVEEMKVNLENEIEEERDAARLLETIEETVRKFHGSQSIDELLKYVRHPERVRPLMEDYYSRHPLKPTVVKDISGFSPITIESRSYFWLVKTTLDSSGTNQVLVEVESNEVAKVDWESHVCYQPVDWEEFVDERPDGYSGEFRVYVKPDNFYTHEFADSERYASYMLETMGSDEYLIGYVPRGGRLFKEIEYLLTRADNSRMAMILALHIRKGSRSKRGVLIEELVAPRWVYLKSPEVDSQ